MERSDCNILRQTWGPDGVVREHDRRWERSRSKGESWHLGGLHSTAEGVRLIVMPVKCQLEGHTKRTLS